MYYEIELEDTNTKASGQIPTIKAFLALIREMDLGGLIEAKEFICGQRVLVVYSDPSIRRIIRFCKDLMLNLVIHECRKRRMTATEIKALAERGS